MCTYIVERTAVTGSAKGPEGWMPVTTAVAAVDHPAHATLDHALIVDFLNPSRGPGARVAVELSVASARELISCMQSALEAFEKTG